MDNLLEDVVCPECGKCDRFFVEVLTLFEVTKDECAQVPTIGDDWFSGDNVVECGTCGFRSIGTDFKKG